MHADGTGEVVHTKALHAALGHIEDAYVQAKEKLRPEVRITTNAVEDP